MRERGSEYLSQDGQRDHLWKVPAWPRLATSCRTAPGHVMVALRWLQLLNEKASKLWTVVADAMRPSELEEFD
jgi:hypothetical protein